MDCKSQPREGRHQQESVRVMSELCTVVPGSATAASPTPHPLKSAVCCSKRAASCCLANVAACDISDANAWGCSGLLPKLPDDDGSSSKNSSHSVALPNPHLKMPGTFWKNASVITDEMKAAVDDPAFWDSDDDSHEMSDPGTVVGGADSEVSQLQSVQMVEKGDGSTETRDAFEPGMSLTKAVQSMKEDKILHDPEILQSYPWEMHTDDLRDCRPRIDAKRDVDSFLACENSAGADGMAGRVDCDSVDKDGISQSASTKIGTEARDSFDYGPRHREDLESDSHVGNADCNNSCFDGENAENHSNVFKNSADCRNSTADDTSDIVTNGKENDCDDDRDEIKFEIDSDDEIGFGSDCQFTDDEDEFPERDSDSDDSIQFLTADEVGSNENFGFDMDLESYGRASAASPDNAGMSSGYSSSCDGLDAAEDQEALDYRLCIMEANRKWNFHYWQVPKEYNSAEVVFEPQQKSVVHQPAPNSLPSKSLLKISSQTSLTSDILSCFRETSVACFTSTLVQKDGVSVEEFSSSSYSIELKGINSLESSSNVFSAAPVTSAAADYVDVTLNSTSCTSKITSFDANRATDEVDYLCNTRCTLDASLITSSSDAKLISEKNKSFLGTGEKPIEVLVNLFPTDLFDGKNAGEDLPEDREATDVHDKFEAVAKCDTNASNTSFSTLMRSTECNPVQLVMDAACRDVESCVSQEGVDYEDLYYDGVVETFDIVKNKDGLPNLRALLSYQRVPFDLLSTSSDQFREISCGAHQKPSPGDSVQVDEDNENAKNLIALNERGVTGRRRRRRVVFNLAVNVRSLHVFLAEHRAARDGRCWMQCAVDRARERRAAGRPETGEDSDEDQSS